MTMIFAKKARCAVCGTKTEYDDICSTNELGSPDLDTRPPEMNRSTIFAWVQRCPECGYCTYDVSKAPSHPPIVRSPEYKWQLSDETYPELANSFLCKALVDQTAGDHAAAAWALIYAAWACDDAGTEDSARKCRAKAADMITKAITNGQQVAEQNEKEIAIQVDLLRRAGRVAEARQLISEKSPTITEDIISRILAFQEGLLSKGDVASHTIAEALGENE